MKTRILIFAAIGVVVASGCSGGSNKVASNSGTGEPERPVRIDSGPPKTTPGITTPPGGVTNPGGTPPGTSGTPGTPGKIDKMPEVSKPRPEAFEINEKGEGGWVSTKVDAKTLAKNVAKALSTMQATGGETVTTLTTPSGHGQVRGTVKIQNDKSYSIQFPVVQKMPAVKEFRSDGKLKALSTENGVFPQKIPASKTLVAASLTPQKVASAWPRKFPEFVYLSLVEDQDPWQPLIEGLVSGSSGFETQVTQRTMKYQGRDITNFRLTAKRTPAAAKKFGPCEMEMVFDGKRYLPVTIRMNFKDPKEGEYKVLWQAAWKFKQAFKKEDFAL